jgi:hypothetical protein
MTPCGWHWRVASARAEHGQDARATRQISLVAPLGLLVSAANASFEAQRNGFQQLATDMVLLDRTLAHYGPDAKAAREQLARTVTSMIDRLLAC